MNKKIVSVALIIIGAGLLYWGYSVSQSMSSQVSEVFSGSPADNVMVKYILGAVCIGVGGFLFWKNR